MEEIKFDLKLYDVSAPMKSTDAAVDSEGNPSFENGDNNNVQATIKSYYVKELLRNAEPHLVFNQFGQKKPIPRGNGKTIEWRKWSKLPAVPADLAIQEGVTPRGTKRSVKSIIGTVGQYGDYIKHTDIIEVTAFDPVITEDCREQGVQAGKTLDLITRNELMNSSNVMFAGGKSDFSTLVAKEEEDTPIDALTVNDVFKAVNKLERFDISPIEGADYVAIVHPDVATQLMLDEKWVDVTKYTTSDKIFNGEIGKIANCRFVKTTQAPLAKTTTASGQAAVYCTMFIGANAYGVTELEGLGLEYIIKPKGYGDDPLNLVGSTGWKATAGAKVLDDSALLKHWSCTFRSGETNIVTNYDIPTKS